MLRRIASIARPVVPPGRRPSARPAPETDRIARLGEGCRLLVFGFWTGPLPPIARLHFETVARALPEGARYVLLGWRAVLPRAMQALLDRLGIAHVPFDLPALMREQGLGRHLARTPLSPFWPALRRFARRRRTLRPLDAFGHRHPVMPFTPRRNPWLGGPPIGPAILSDYARVLVGALVPGHTLYTDIDFAFPRPLDWVLERASFVYRWERYDFANSALMALRPGAPAKRGALLDLVARLGTPIPWILFSQARCRALGLEILPCDRLDPLWSATSPSGPDFAEFFTPAADAAETLRRLRTDFDAVHWHNRWDLTPERGSPYDLWLEA